VTTTSKAKVFFVKHMKHELGSSSAPKLRRFFLKSCIRQRRKRCGKNKMPDESMLISRH